MDVSNIEAIFIDRDGTIGGSTEVVLPGKFQLYSKVQESIVRLKRSGVILCAFTNQPGISRGESTKESFVNELQHFGFDYVFICPHEHSERCHCRKPSPGMLIQATKELYLDLKNCVVIGDRWTDMLAAEEIGCMNVLLLTESGRSDLDQYENREFYGKWLDLFPNYVAEDFNDAVDWISRRNDGSYCLNCYTDIDYSLA